MLKIVTYQSPSAEVLQVYYEQNFLATGEGMNPKPMGVAAPDADNEDEI